MSEIVSSEYSGGIRTTTYENKRVFIFNNTFLEGTMNNSTYDQITYPKGTLLGRIGSSGILVPLVAGASNGSQFPVGVLAGDYTIQDGDSVTVSMCVSGEVNSNALVLAEGTTLDTVISTRRLRDRIAADTVGITLVDVQEL